MIDLEGTVIVTGGNGGLGSAIVSQIVNTPHLNQSHHGLYTVRNPASAKTLDKAIASSTSSSHSYEKIALDLSELDNIRHVAKGINERIAAGTIPWIRALILNAGYEEFGIQTWTQHGLDMTFVINYLGHWLLTLLLLQSMDPDAGRIVWISSWSHNPHDPRNSWNGSFKEVRYKTIFNSKNMDPIAKGLWSANQDDKGGWAAGYRRYGASKLCCVTTIFELQRRLDKDPKLHNISVLGVDPGLVNTGIVRRSESWFLRVVLWQWVLPIIAVVLVRFIPNGPLRTAKKSASDIIAAALGNDPPPLSSRPKGLYLNGSELGVRNPEAKDSTKAIMLWRDTLRYTQLNEKETCLVHWQ